MTDECQAKSPGERAEGVIVDALYGREGSREAIQRLADETPELRQLLAEKFGNAAARAEDALVRSAAAGNVLDQESTRAWLAGVMGELAEPGDAALEAMLAHRVALCWLAVNDAEAERAKRWAEGISYASGDFWDRHLARLNADLFKATKALATVRKLRRPVVQVNVAERQVNVASVDRPIPAGAEVERRRPAE